MTRMLDAGGEGLSLVLMYVTPVSRFSCTDHAMSCMKLTGPPFLTRGLAGDHGWVCLYIVHMTVYLMLCTQFIHAIFINIIVVQLI